MPSSLFSRFLAWFNTHKILNGLSGLILFGLGIYIPWYLSVLDLKDKFDGRYDLMMLQGRDEYQKQIEDVAQARQLVLQRSLESGSGLQEDLKIASDWNGLGTSAIAFWQPLLECGRTKECLPGRKGPEACERITRLTDTIDDISELLRSMGQLANLGMGGERYKEPNTESIKSFIENVCTSDEASETAVFKARQALRERVLRRAYEEWKKLSAAAPTAQRDSERYDQAVNEMDDLRLFQLRFRKVLEEVPGLLELEKAHAAREARLQEAWTIYFARVICDVQQGNATLFQLEKIPNLRPKGCYQDDSVSSCNWIDFSKTLRGRGLARVTNLNEVMQRTIQLCHSALPTSEREQTIENYNEPAYGSFCENKKITYLVESRIAYVTDQCGAWTSLEIVKTPRPGE